MAYVITQNCCKDASCVPVCPVDCIRPAGGPGEFTGTEMLYIDPEACIDCGACMDECPVDAIHYEEDLPEHLERFRELNAAYFERHPLQPEATPPDKRHGPVENGSLRVAVVGAGPAACYAADELIAVDGVEVDMFERLPTPFGLVRAGVAPDHQHTKSVVSLFTSALADKRFGCHLNVEIGRHLGHQDLMDHHHAVIYAVGCSASRNLGIPGEDLPGSHPASDVVGWYNGHPDHAHHRFDLSGRRAVIVGNGNVALDVARILLTPPDLLAGTDIAEHALEALAHNSIEEVVILGRRGPRAAAFSVGEFLALGHLPGVDVVIDGSGLEPDPDDDIETAAKLDVAREYARRTPTPGNKRVVFRFGCSPTAIEGSESAQGLQVNGSEVIETSLILRSIGYRGESLPDLPFDDSTGTVTNDRGRVTDGTGKPVTGVYVTGWIKRGPQGVIGTNRSCAEQTVAQLLTDFDAGLLRREVAARDALRALMDHRGLSPVDWSGWRAIDTAERERGSAASRPRVKLVAMEELLAAARSSRG
ncbi:FAD-dependent oxidoreductase [Mycolicibacterium hippocampi]|uniref:ferredoxin--NADP(+) reductase n=1 Tax=Mycolicibacterium hippocampi TaxID=659824 RepID=A0A7I9ZTD7_9MYCO|nr:FAD-dependent oxidoreductase [Mycolicibacterium hippocampi]GFH03948.1 putative ferredoxin/ferredoxin--NADP reductase [Mycolicibacterium hippocampi]